MIKKIIPSILILAALTASSFGGDFERGLFSLGEQVQAKAEVRRLTEELTWEQIEANYAPDWPLLAFEGRTLSMRDLCHVNGERFELRGAMKTITVCRDHGYDSPACVRSEEVKVSVPVLFEYESCSDRDDDRRDRCSHPVKVTERRPLTYAVDVYQRGRDEDRVALFTKSYTVPACAN